MSSTTRRAALPPRVRGVSRFLRAAAVAAGVLCGSAAASTGTGLQPFAGRPEVEAFVDRVASEHGFAAGELRRLLASIDPDPRVLELMDPPARTTARRSWRHYRQRFVNRSRIDAGLRFWFENEAAIARASARYGVPEEIIVGIIGVETIYGRHTGTFPVAASLATLAFHFPRRADFFRGELEQFLVLARDTGMDPLAVRGSYAGAIGLPQFMPSSIRNYAVDFDGDGRVDLAGSTEDAIGSVANFLAEHGWERGAPTRVPVRLAAGADTGPLVEAGIEPRFDAAQLAAHGVQPAVDVPSDTLFALIDLPNADAPPDYALGPRNFYVLTRYNRSSFYATAVIALGEAVRAARARAIAAADDAREPGQAGKTPLDR
jgi:membrane-bound lytic murein transglycosylase B